MHNVQACITRMSAGRKTAMLHTYDLMSLDCFFYFQKASILTLPSIERGIWPENELEAVRRELNYREILRWIERIIMLKFIRSKGNQQPTAERQKLQKELYAFRKVSQAVMKANQKAATTSKYLHVCITNCTPAFLISEKTPKKSFQLNSSRCACNSFPWRNEFCCHILTTFSGSRETLR